MLEGMDAFSPDTVRSGPKTIFRTGLPPAVPAQEEHIAAPNMGRPAVDLFSGNLEFQKILNYLNSASDEAPDHEQELDVDVNLSEFANDDDDDV